MSLKRPALGQSEMHATAASVCTLIGNSELPFVDKVNSVNHTSICLRAVPIGGCVLTTADWNCLSFTKTHKHSCVLVLTLIAFLSRYKVGLYGK